MITLTIGIIWPEPDKIRNGHYPHLTYIVGRSDAPEQRMKEHSLVQVEIRHDLYSVETRVLRDLYRHYRLGRCHGHRKIYDSPARLENSRLTMYEFDFDSPTQMDEEEKRAEDWSEV